MLHRSRPQSRSSADDNIHIDNLNPSTPVELQRSLSSHRFDLLAEKCMIWLHTGKVAAVPKQAAGQTANITSDNAGSDSVFNKWCSTSCI